jgi:hypothetical protein
MKTILRTKFIEVGNLYYGGDTYPAGYRTYGQVTLTYGNWGYREVLYIK